MLFLFLVYQQRYKTTPDTEEQSEEPRQQKFFKKTPADEEAASIKTQEDPRSALSSLTDKQTMRNILTGSQCLQGVRETARPIS